MYECIKVAHYVEDEKTLNEEGDLDNESDDSDFEREFLKEKEEMFDKRRSTSSTSSSTRAIAHGSPMSVD